MSNLNSIPTQFKVLSTHPDLKIRYSNSLLDWCLGFFTFIGGIVILITMIFYLNFTENINVEGISRENQPYFIVAMSIVSIPASLYWIWSGAFIISGYQEFLATRDRLIVTDTCRLLGVCSQTSIPASGISRLEISSLSGINNEDDDFWRLNAIADRHCQGNWKLFLTWFPLIKLEKTINLQIFLYGHGIRQWSEWLGRLLADFYRVELRSP